MRNNIAAAAEVATQAQAAVEAAARSQAAAEEDRRAAWEVCRSMHSQIAAVLTKTPEAARGARIADWGAERSDLAAATGAEAATWAQAAVAEEDLGAARAHVRTKRVGAEDAIAEKHGNPGDSGRTGTDVQAASDGEARLGDGGHQRKRLRASPGQVCPPPHPTTTATTLGPVQLTHRRPVSAGDHVEWHPPELEHSPPRPLRRRYPHGQRRGRGSGRGHRRGPKRQWGRRRGR